MAHVGTITGSMTLDPSAYLAGLNRAAQATTAFRTSMTGSGMAFNQFGTNANNIAGMMGRFNTSIYASMTAFYALSRTISSSLGVFEEYSNIMSRISATADLSASSVNALSESFKKLNRELGGSRTDLMKGVYTAIQANFTRPSEFMPIGEAAMRLRTASGREIDTQKSADVISVVRNALGVRSGREGAITDMLLRGRDIGRYELKEMASALGIPITVFGNQFGARLGPEETLRQLIAILSSATQTGLAPRTAATGTRRLVEKTTRLAAAPGGVGKNLTQALGSLGYGSISEALNEGPIPYLENILKLTGGRPEELAKLGFGAREFMLLSSSLRNNMGQTRQFYQELSPGNIAGTTDKYIDKHKDTWWYQRDRLRSAYEDTQIGLMNALVPTMKSLANSLEVINDLFQALAPSIKQLIGLIALGAGASILKNFYMRGGGGVGRHNSFAMSPPRLENFGRIGSDFFRHGIRKPVISTPAQRTYGNQIYGGSGNIFGNVHPSYYGGGISPVGWHPLNGSLASSSGVSHGAVRYNRRDTEGRFVPSWYNIRNAQGQLIPMSQNRMSPVSNPTFRERMLDRVGGAAMWASNALNNRPSYTSIPGMTSAIKAGAFMFGGRDYRVERIQDKYNSRIAAANEALKSGTMSAHRSASGLYKTLTSAGMGDARASSEAANHLNKALNDVNQKFNQTAASAQRSARFVGSVSSALGALGSVANMAAIGGIIQLLSDFINGLNSPKSATKSGGVIDLSKAGKLHSTGMLNPGNMWGNVRNAAGLIGTAIGVGFDWLSGGERDFVEEVVDGVYERALKKGRIAKEDLSPNLLQRLGFGILRFTGAGGYLNTAMFENMSTRKATLSDSLERALRENFSPLEQRQLRFAGYGKMTPELQRSFEEFLKSGKLGNKYEGITHKDFGQRTNIPGRNPNETGYDIQTEFLTSFLRSKEVEQKVTEVTTKRIAEMGITAEKAADSLALISPINNIVGFEQMDALRQSMAPNMYANEMFWKNAKQKSAYTDVSGYNNMLMNWFNNSGVVPDMYTTRGKMRPNETPSGFLDSLLSDKSDVLMPKLLGGMGGDTKTLANIRNAMKLLESLPHLGGASNNELGNLVQNMFGSTSLENPFFEQAKSMIRKLDVNQFIDLVPSGQKDVKAVQDYSDAISFGTGEGYNATLPYWAQEGEDKMDLVVKNFDALLKLADTLMGSLSDIETNVRTTTEAVVEYGE